MADKLIFPIGFDLESGLKQAETDIKRISHQIESVIKNKPINIPVGFDAATAQKLRNEAKDIERVLADIKNNYGNGQLKGLTIGLIDTSREVQAIKQIETKLRELQQQRASLVNGGATVEELGRIDKAIKQTELHIKEMWSRFNRDQSSNVAIANQIIQLKRLSEELAGIDRMYARLQAVTAQSGKSAYTTFEGSEMLARRKEILEEITRITRTATEAQKELFNIKGLGAGAKQGVFGFGGETGLTAITEQIQRYEQLQKKLQGVTAEIQRMRAIEAQGGTVNPELFNAALQRRIAIQKELTDITQGADKAQKDLEKRIQATAAAFQRGRSAIENFNNTMKLPENRIMNIKAKIDALNQALQRVGVGSSRFKEITSELDRLNQKLDEAKGKQQALSSTQEQGAKKTAAAFKEQNSYLENLVQKMAVYASVSSVMGFVSKIKEVTAQFEIQQISLGAIINDQKRAKQLFNEITQFAIQSPIKILDLTKYTKQMAAFRFETDTLFETTKRVADVAVGLSVPMDRLILALGHVKSATYLTGITLRQFALAGIPMLELLAEKYSELEGRAVTTAEVQKRVHDRLVSFEDVNQVFTDLTSKGGMFYDMQIKQGNTLYGMWAKLGDAASLMYSQIGNSGAVNSAMKNAIQTLRYLMLNWKQVGIVIAAVTTIITSNIIATKNAAVATAAATTANKLHVASLKWKIGTLRIEQANLRAGAVFQRLYIAGTIAATRAQIAAATSTNIFSKALYAMKAALLSNPLTALAVALTTIIALFMQSEDHLDKLKRELQDIDRDYGSQGKKAVERFTELTKTVEESIDGSKAQKDALEELNRTYGQILGSEALELENLKSLHGQYGDLVDMINAYNAVKKGEEKASQIKSTYSSILEEEKDDLMDHLNAFGMRSERQAEFITMINQKMEEYAGSADAAQKATDETFAHFRDELSSVAQFGNLFNVFNLGKAVDSWGGMFRQAGGYFGGQGVDYLYNYARAIESQNTALDKNEEETRLAADACGVYSSTVNDANKALKNFDWSSSEALYTSMTDYNVKHPKNTISVAFDLSFDPSKAENEFDKMLEMSNSQINFIFSKIQSIAEQEGVKIPTTFYTQAKSVVEGNKDFSLINFDSLLGLFTNEKAKSAIRELQKLYEGIAPPDPIVQAARKNIFTIADSMKDGTKRMKKYLWDGKTDIKDHLETLKESAKTLKAEIFKYSKYIQLFGSVGKATLIAMGIDVDALTEEYKALTKQIDYVQQYVEESDKSKTTKSDDRLQKAQEAVSILEKLYSRYKELRKTMSHEDATAYINRYYSSNIAYLKKYGVAFDGTLATYQKGLKKMRDTISKLPKSSKAVAEVDLKIGDTSLKDFEEKIKQQLEKISKEISKSKAAKEFFDKILTNTMDYNLAVKLTMSVYGETGNSLQKEMANQLQTALKGGTDENGNIWGVKIDAKDIIDPTTFYINYSKLRDILKDMGDTIPDEQRKTLEDILKNGESFNKSQVEQWAKDLAKVKDYTDQYIDLYRMTEMRKAEIRQKMESNELDEGAGKRELADYDARLAKEQAKIQYEAFKNSPMYTSLFENMEDATVQALQKMRTRIKEMMAATKDPTQLKELQSRLNELNDILAEKSPFETIAKGWKTMGKMATTYGSRLKLDELIDQSQTEINDLQAQQTNALKKEAKKKEAADALGATSKEAAITPEQRQAWKAYQEASNAVEKLADAIEKAEEKQREYTNDRTKWAKAISTVKKGLKTVIQIGQKFLEASEAAAKFAEALGMSEDGLELFNDINNVISNTLNFADSLIACIGLMAKTTKESISTVEKASIILTAISLALQVATAIFNLFSNAKVRKANKEIERQQELLDQLEYTYSRLEKAADKAFGSDYISKHQQQIRNLQAQVQAYQRQYEAEMSKGKKADKDKLKDYKEKVRDTLDEIAEMQSKISEKMFGTDLGSAARDFAKSWLDAYKEFSNTSDAMSEKFHDMIQNMVVEGLLARVMEQALKPAFDMIDKMGTEDFYSDEFWNKVVATAEQGTKNADYGAQTMMSFLEKVGVSMRNLGGEMTGISREISGASEESINGLAAGINTQNYYMSHVPTISENVMAIRALMEGGNVSLGKPSFDTTALWNQHLELQQGIHRHTAETVEECRAIAKECAAIATTMGRVVETKGAKSMIRTSLAN